MARRRVDAIGDGRCATPGGSGGTVCACDLLCQVVKPILHRDIKPGNVFMDANHNAKLGPWRRRDAGEARDPPSGDVRPGAPSHEHRALVQRR